jgi:(2Fe-2S) ferredoxin
MELSGVSKHVLLCNGASCTKKGSEEVTNAIRQDIKDQGLLKKIHTTKTLCNGRCKEGPTVIVYPDGDWYKEMTPEKGLQLIEKLKSNQKLKDSLSYTFNGHSFSTKEYT